MAGQSQKISSHFPVKKRNFILSGLSENESNRNSASKKQKLDTIQENEVFVQSNEADDGHPSCCQALKEYYDKKLALVTEEKDKAVLKYNNIRQKHVNLLQIMSHHQIKIHRLEGQLNEARRKNESMQPKIDVPLAMQELVNNFALFFSILHFFF